MGSPNSNRRPRVSWEGFVFAHVLSNRALSLRLFRLLPVGYIRLDRVAYVRRRSPRDLRNLFLPGRCYYWPHPLFMGRAEFDHAPYMIRMVNGAQVFVRMRHGFHYRLRDAIGRVKADAAEQAARAAEARAENIIPSSDVG